MGVNCSPPLGTGVFSLVLPLSSGPTCKSKLLPLPYARIVEELSAEREEDLDINVRKRGSAQLIQLRGPLRMGPAVDSLRQTIEETLGNGDTRLILNLAEVPMIDSSGIGLVVRFLASTKQRGGNLKLVQPTKFAIQTLRLVGVLNLFEIFDTDDAAIASFT